MAMRGFLINEVQGILIFNYFIGSIVEIIKMEELI